LFENLTKINLKNQTLISKAMGYIYSITNKINGKRYIGQTLQMDIHDRWKSHLKKGTHCRYLKYAFDKYSIENFKFEVIIICFDNDCDRYEKEYMDRFNTLVPNGYNLREAGNNGRHNEETKKKISQTVISNCSKMTVEERKEKFGKLVGEKNHNFGKKWSLERKLAFSKIMKSVHKKIINPNNNLKGLVSSNERKKKKVSCFTFSGEFVASYESILQASKMNNCAPRGISDCCKGKYRSNKGFVWKFV
jgi:group I intron endonuclease